jgi:hypothetical protein
MQELTYRRDSQFQTDGADLQTTATCISSDIRDFAWISNQPKLRIPVIRGGAVGWGTALQSRKVPVSIPSGVIEIFQWKNSFPPHYGTAVDSVANRNEW